MIQLGGQYCFIYFSSWSFHIHRCVLVYYIYIMHDLHDRNTSKESEAMRQCPYDYFLVCPDKLWNFEEGRTKKEKKNSRRSPLDMQSEASRRGVASALGKAFIFSFPLQIKVYTLQIIDSTLFACKCFRGTFWF